ncbi:MAG TPA: aldo/keto reductase [Herpetosiphonaceae bacterium]
MRYRNLGRTGLKVSEVCLGTMTFGWTADEAVSRAIMSAARDAGINFFDTADMYSRWSASSYAGKTEEIIGRWLKEQPRDQVIVATKVRGAMGDGPNDQGLSRKHIKDAIDGSLRRLQTEYIDLYQTHWPDLETPLEETLRALDDLVRDGKIRYIGCSNSPAWYTTKALWVSDKHNLVRYETLQPHYNLAHRGEFERELLALCRDQGLGVIPYSPLAGGFLTGKYRRGQPAPEGSRGEQSQQIKRYMQHERSFDLIEKLDQIGRAHGKTVPQVAIAWLIDAPAVTSPIIGANTVAQLYDTLGAVGFTLSADERAQLDELSSWEE